MNAPPVQPGDILAHKYRVERVLGAGNMGVVVAATHVDLGQVVALKHMLSGRAASREQRERFLREARAAVRLKSHHVARVLDVGAQEDEAPYIVMEYLEGYDLAALLKARGSLPFEEAVEYVLQVCEAVGEAHAAGIVHRDLKPANLFLTYDVSGAPCVKVLDFGISKLAGAELALTGEAQSLGSPLYMSPEQMSSSKSVDARSDVWALGIILYQLVAGMTPFHAETVPELCMRVLSGHPTPLGHYRPDAPPGFEAVILRCLAKEREGRYRDVAELAAAVAPYAPPHARVYAERVARVVHMKTPRLSSSPDLSAHVRPSAPPAREPIAAHPPPPPPRLEMTAEPRTERLPSATQPPADPQPPRVAAPSAPPLGGETGLTLSSSQTAARPHKHKPAASGRALLIIPAVLIALAIPATILVTRGMRATVTAQASSPFSALIEAATPPSSLVGSSIASSPSPPNGTETAPPAGVGSSDPPAPSSQQQHPPPVLPSGSKPKPPPAPDLYNRQ